MARQLHRLVTIRFSHFNEIARWALDRARIPYDEVVAAPLASQLLVLRHAGLGRADRMSSPLSTPVLVRGDEQDPLRDSADIVRFADEQIRAAAARGAGEGLPGPLYDAENPGFSDVLELRERFHHVLNVKARRVAYANVLCHAELSKRIIVANVGRDSWQGWGVSVLYPLLQVLVNRGLGIKPELTLRDEQAVRDEFAFVSELLADGRRYLAGDAFSAADLEFCAGAAIVMGVQPEEGYGGQLYRPSDCDAHMRAIVDELRASPAGQYVLRMYREERGERVVPCSTPLTPMSAL